MDTLLKLMGESNEYMVEAVSYDGQRNGMVIAGFLTH